MNKTNLFDLSPPEFHQFFRSLGWEDYRARQIAQWLYRKGCSDFEAMTNLSRSGRALLAERAALEELNLLNEEIAHDGTRKLLWGLKDGQAVESVLIPEEDRLTLCISTQVGCALGCLFCYSGKDGWVRNLKVGEISGQVLGAQKLTPQKISNYVFMGSGEPLANYNALAAALAVMTEFMSISPRRITVSTAGPLPPLERMSREAWGVNLAVSLNAADDKIRSYLMPLNKKYPLSSLIGTLKKFPLAARRRITIEYLLLAGVNDSPSDAAKLAVLLKGLRCKINLIPFNPWEGSSFKRPPKERVLAFQQVLLDNNFTALIRQSRGQDIKAACGQLRGAAKKAG
jgi:23S rRNA (adenine2503-C2)-methyltransferase